MTSNVEHGVRDTQPDGSTIKIHGVYAIEWQNPAGDWVALPTLQAVPTGRGVNLLPGTYRVTVSHKPTGSPTAESHVYNITL